MLTIFLILIGLFTFANSTCSFTASGRTLNLKPLSSYTLSATDGDYIIDYTPCKSTTVCSKDGKEYMALQFKLDSCTAGLAVDSGESVTFSNVSGGIFNLQYSNGSPTGCSSNRKFLAVYVCDEQANPYGPIVAGEPGTCSYQLTIPTIYACADAPSSSSSSSSSSGLSGGWVFIIILLVLLTVYCLGGYIFNKTRNPENTWGDVRKNAPHLSFWRTVPKWTWTGCLVTKEWIQSKISGSSGGEYQKQEDTPNA